MTPPVRPTWTEPDFRTLGDALAEASERASAMGAANTVCLHVHDATLGFDVMLSETYAALRESGLGTHLAPVASALPNGTIDLYPALTTLRGTTHV